MMEICYQWIKMLVVHALLFTAVLEMVPDHMYKKYIQVFVGMILALFLLSTWCRAKEAIKMEEKWIGQMERTHTDMDTRKCICSGKKSNVHYCTYWCDTNGMCDPFKNDETAYGWTKGE